MTTLLQANPEIANALLIGTITAVLGAGVDADPDDLASRLWSALRT
ncbi:MAG: hypothetical protein ACR2QO_28035 [Acidimicrobiales bacterium]